MADLPSLGDYTWATQAIDVSAGGFVQFLPADRRRAALHIQPVVTFSAFVWVDSLAAGSKGFLLNGINNPLTLLARDWGPLIQQAWHYQVQASAGNFFYVTELFYISPPHARGL